MAIHRSHPAYKIQDHKQILGKFKVGLQVNVLEPHADTRHWVVEYPRIGAPNIRALIAEPDLSVVHRYAFKQVTPIIDACAILKSQLEAEQPLARHDRCIVQQVVSRRQLKI